MADTGLVTPAAFASVEHAAGDVAWSGVANAGASDDSRATASVGADGFTQRLQGTALGLAVPVGVTIDGVELVVEGGADGGSTAFLDALVRLLRAGAVDGDDRSVASHWSATERLVTYGGPTDLWGLALTPADVNAADFGAAIRWRRDGTSVKAARVDHVQLRVHFTATAAALAPADGAHGHAAATGAFGQQHQLAVDGAHHGHLADGATLAPDGGVAAMAGAHAHLAAVVGLQQIHVVAVAGAAHGLTGTVPSLALMTMAPDGRTLRSGADRRRLTVSGTPPRIVRPTP